MIRPRRAGRRAPGPSPAARQRSHRASATSSVDLPAHSATGACPRQPAWAAAPLAAATQHRQSCAHTRARAHTHSITMTTTTHIHHNHHPRPRRHHQPPTLARAHVPDSAGGRRAMRPVRQPARRGCAGGGGGRHGPMGRRRRRRGSPVRGLRRGGRGAGARARTCPHTAPHNLARARTQLAPAPPTHPRTRTRTLPSDGARHGHAPTPTPTLAHPHTRVQGATTHAPAHALVRRTPAPTHPATKHPPLRHAPPAAASSAPPWALRSP